MRTGHNANINRYTQIQEDLAASESAIMQLDGSSNDNADQYQFLQEMRGYVGDLLECFGEKVREIMCSVLRCFVSLYSDHTMFLNVQVTNSIL